MAKKPNSIDEYLAALPGDQRKVLEALRRTIKSAAPKAEECISYGVPAFRQNGMLVGFGGAAKHCSLFLMSGSMLESHRELLQDYDTSKGTIRFTTGRPLPAALVKKLVKLRLAENESRRKKGKLPREMTDTRADRTSRAAQRRKSDAKSAPKTGAKGKPAAATKPVTAKAASGAIVERIRSLGGWRGKTLAEVRRLIHEADPDMAEAIKWVKPTNPGGVPVWSHAGIVCTGEPYQQVVKLTFARGASLRDPRGLFNASLEGNARRAIDIREGDSLDAEAFKSLIRAAVAENLRSRDTRSRGSKSQSPTETFAKARPNARKAKPTKLPRNEQGVVLLSGGNPQIAKADGDAPVQAYITAMPGWKRDLGRRLDALIVRAVPSVPKAVKWNSPFYGLQDQGWFLSFHCFAKYVKVAFFRGASMRPLPPGESKQKEVRYLDIHEDDVLDERQFAAWVKQASQLPGERL